MKLHACGLIAAIAAVPCAFSIPLPLSHLLDERAVLYIANETSPPTVPTVNVAPADPATYNSFLKVAIRNHWSEAVTLPRPDTSKVLTENSLQTNCPHLAPDLQKWENPATWLDNIVPNANGSDVNIPGGKSVLISAGSLNELSTYGIIRIPQGSKLVFNDASITLNTNGILIDGGSLALGSETCRLKSYINIILHGIKPSPLIAVPPIQVKGIAATNGGTLDIHGQSYAPTWTRLAVTAKKGDVRIIIQDAVNWEVGQSIVITTTVTKDSRDFNQNEELQITTITRADGIGSQTSIIGLSAPLRYNHYGGSEYQAEVGLLSRRIVVQGDATSVLTDTPDVCKGDTVSKITTFPCGPPKGYGGHIIINGTGIGRVSGVELYHMGQTNVMGRYPYHIHMAKDNGRNSYLKYSAIRNSFFRCMSVHGSSNVTISQNVAFSVTGHCFYLEDGIEEDNLFEYNLAAHIHFFGPPVAPNDFWGQQLPTVMESSDLILPSDITAAGFYISNPRNSFIGNAASGGWSGIIFPIFQTPMGLHRNLTSISPRSRPIKVFDGNSAHSSGYWWGNGGAIYVGGLLKYETNGTMSYNPGRTVGATTDACNAPLKSYGCDQADWAWLRFSNTKVFLANRGMMYWGNRAEILRYEGHDCGISANVFGQVWLDNMLSICRTQNTDIPLFGGCNSTKYWECSYRDRNYASGFYGFQWYDTEQNHIITNSKFRNCSNAWKPAITPYSTTMAVWSFLTHSDQFVPGIMQATKNISYENVNNSQIWAFSNPKRITVSGRLQNWLDTDGSASLSPGRTIMGSDWANDWWNLWGLPKCRKAAAPPLMGMWLCTDDTAFIASMLLTADASKLSRLGTAECSNGDQSISCPTVGYAYHLGATNATAGLALTLNAKVTGPVAKNGGEWVIRYNQGAPVSLSINRIQFLSETNTVGLVIQYPAGTTFNITAYAATWCYKDCKHAYIPSTSLSTYQQDALSRGDAYFFDTTTNLLHVSVVQLNDATLGGGGVSWIRSQVNPTSFSRAGITLTFGPWSSMLIIGAKCNSTDGVYCAI
ncbi:Fibrocystin-L [Chytriomyces hyalinus]|nr:Fibrocystin-L [Chytriomyces hyalinus]